MCLIACVLKMSRDLVLNVQLVFLSLLLTYFETTGRPVAQDANNATITQQSFDNDGLGNYNYTFSTSNGISRNESGKLRDADSDNPTLAVQGVYQYTYNGTTYIVQYTADENGFVPNITTQTIGVRIGPDAVASLIGPG